MCVNRFQYGMKIKGQTIYDLNSEQFKYLQKEDDKSSLRVDINKLNKRLNQAKRSNFYTTSLVVVFFISSLIALSIISIKF